MKLILFFLVSVVVLFFVSWAPFHFQRLGYVYFKHLSFYRAVNQILFYLSGCFYFLSSTLNPILYNVMSAKYRNAFKTVVFCVQPERPLGWNLTIHTSTTLLSSTYLSLHLKDYLGSRRSSRAESQTTPSYTWQNRASSISTSTHLLPLHAKTNLSRQISFSDSGGKTCPKKSGFLSPSSALGRESVYHRVAETKGISPFNSFPTLVEEKEESSV